MYVRHGQVGTPRLRNCRCPSKASRTPKSYSFRHITATLGVIYCFTTVRCSPVRGPDVCRVQRMVVCASGPAILADVIPHSWPGPLTPIPRGCAYFAGLLRYLTRGILAQ